MLISSFQTYNDQIKNKIEFDTSEFNLDMDFYQYVNTNDKPFEVTLIPSIFDKGIKCINATSSLEQTAEILNT